MPGAPKVQSDRGSQGMGDSNFAILIETDPSAAAQMQRVLSQLELSAMVAADRDAALEMASNLSREGAAPQLIVSRVTTPTGSGLEILDEVAKLFPDAAQVLVSHYPQRLLLHVPGF